MCFFFSCQWMKEDCGCKHQKEETEYYADAHVYDDTDTNEVVVDAVVVV